jgi:hypothetical protein
MYLPSFPRYALIPEATLTPAPVRSVTFPGARKSAMRSTAAAGEIVRFGAPKPVIMVGTETRMMSVVQVGLMRESGVTVIAG